MYHWRQGFPSAQPLTQKHMNEDLLRAIIRGYDMNHRYENFLVRLMSRTGFDKTFLRIGQLIERITVEELEEAVLDFIEQKFYVFAVGTSAYYPDYFWIISGRGRP